MKMMTGERGYGFTVTRVRTEKELGGTLVEMKHDKTGAELCWMDNGECNKLFSVSFKTLPEDSTGVFHILEHSVLCGSDRYPVKEPFVELLKSSMNTFLNAMTYPDKTVYPVSSRNEQDFLNLTSVYLDAVFAPALLQNPNIFYQEGRHTELQDGAASYKGVVFNEMKGAMSGVDGRLEAGINELLFPDTCYRFNSGGDPAVIPDLTYEQFAATYRRFYHPSNARFFLDGAIPVEKTLAMIGEYLDRYEKEENLPELTYQTPVYREGTIRYEITEEEKEEPRAILTLGKIIGRYSDRERLLAAQVLCDYLADTNESPLKRAVLSSGMAEDFSMYVLDGMAQPYLVVTARNMAEENIDAMRTLVRETVTKLLEDGLDKASLEASINRQAFRYREIPEPQGLYRAIASLSGWLYGGDPIEYLLQDSVLQSVRRMAAEGELEGILRELLLEEDTMAVLTALPSVTLGEEERQIEENRLQREMAARSEAEQKELEELNEKLMSWQQTPDTPEQLATLPVLPLSEARTDPEPYPTEVSREGGVTKLYHAVATHGIVHLSLYFPLTDFTLPELTRLALLPQLFTELPTSTHTVAALQQAIKTYIGQLNFGLSVCGREDRTDSCTPCLSVQASVLKENLEIAQELIAEILTQTQWQEPERIREIVMQADMESRQMAVNAGHVLGVLAVSAQESAKGAVSEATEGYTYIQMLHGLARNYEDQQADLMDLLRRAVAQAVGKKGMTLSVTASEKVELDTLLARLPEGEESQAEASYQTQLPKKMGIRIPAAIAFAIEGYNLARIGKKAAGTLWVASNILSLSYLWNTVRVQGGAYGAGMPVRRDGQILFYSYRDPSPARSLSVYNGSADFLREFCRGEEDLDKFILSAVAATDPLQTPAERGASADDLWFSGVTEEDRILRRRQMVDTKREDLLQWCPVLESIAQEGCICVVGPDAALQECKELTIFDI